ncbi:hypothetical protein ACFWY9_03805 [Amycolatopsis sp. NPDC059027]|uniref:hypothetical protein n=1 Tax=Amycolatopsis sp. NPDC059027 TaxID=3346709 RepID=UPI0036722E85
MSSGIRTKLRVILLVSTFIGAMFTGAPAASAGPADIQEKPVSASVMGVGWHNEVTSNQTLYQCPGFQCNQGQAYPGNDLAEVCTWNASGYKWGLVFNRANEHTGFIPVNYLKYADPDVDCGAAGSDLQVKWNQTLYQCPGSNCNQGQATDGQHVRFFCNFYDSAARTWWRWVFNPNNQHEGFAYVQNQPGAANC